MFSTLQRTANGGFYLMPNRQARAQEALDRFAELRRLSQKLGERASRDAALILDDLAKRIVAAVAQGTSPGKVAVETIGQLNALIREMDAITESLKRDYLSAYGRLYSRASVVITGQIPRVYSVFGRSTVDRIDAATVAFKDATRAQFRPGFELWSKKFKASAADLPNAMTSVLQQAQLSGWDQRTIAQNLLRIPEFQWKNLPPVGERGMKVFTLGGRLKPSDALIRRAHVIAATESQAVFQSMHHTWTAEAGLDKFINVNGDPVAEECIEANEAGAMSWEEWSQWEASNGKGGIPPRHPNCDSLLLAVPDDYASAVEEAMTESATK